MVQPRGIAYCKMRGNPFDELGARILANVKARRAVRGKKEIKAMHTISKFFALVHDEVE
jgi:hypothetical protein